MSHNQRTMKNGFRVIDADGHVRDTPDLLQPYLSPKFRNRPLVPSDAADRTVGGKYGRNPAGPAEQLADMDTEGIDVAVLYGTTALAMWKVKDREVAVDVHRAYNDWLADFCRHSSERLKGVAALPMVEPAAAARELERCVKEHGFVAGMAHTRIHNHSIADSAYDELYSAAQQLDVPIAFHAAGNEIDRFENFLQQHTLGHTHEQMSSVVFVIFGQLVERFPTLKIAFLEGMCGWVPMLAERMDEEFEFRAHEAPLLKKDPSEYFKEGRLFFGTEPDEWTIPHVISFLGTDRTLIYASDYPHWDSDFPHTTSKLADRTDLTDENKRNILGDNATRLYPALARVPAGAR